MIPLINWAFSFPGHRPTPHHICSFISRQNILVVVVVVWLLLLLLPLFLFIIIAAADAAAASAAADDDDTALIVEWCCTVTCSKSNKEWIVKNEYISPWYSTSYSSLRVTRVLDGRCTWKLMICLCDAHIINYVFHPLEVYQGLLTFASYSMCTTMADRCHLQDIVLHGSCVTDVYTLVRWYQCHMEILIFTHMGI